jgi:hypothetical protein
VFTVGCADDEGGCKAVGVVGGKCQTLAARVPAELPAAREQETDCVSLGLENRQEGYDGEVNGSHG